MIYTDGLKKARDGQNSSFGWQGSPRLCSGTKSTAPKGSATRLIHSVLRHCSVQADDLSFLVLKV